MFLAHGDGLTLGFLRRVVAGELDPPATGALADVVGPLPGAVVPDAGGFGVELSLADGDGEPVPLSLDDVLGVGDGGMIGPIPGEEGEALGLALAQLGEAEDPPNGKNPPTGALLLEVAPPDPPPAPPPDPGSPPGDCAELELLGEITCWASRATYAPTATMETVTPSAASGRSHLRVRAVRPPPVLVVGPKRSQASRVTLATHSSALWNTPGARRMISVHAASAQAIATGRGRRSRR